MAVSVAVVRPEIIAWSSVSAVVAAAFGKLL